MSQAPADPSPAYPSIAGYRVEGVLGRGGMGMVYLARQEILDRQVAIKALIPGDAGEDDIQTPERFLNEARILARMEPHPNVTQVHDVVRDAHGSYFIVMELAMGRSLEERFSQKPPISQPEALRVAAQAARGLHQAHRHGIVHRDVKPSNIMLTERGGVKVMDFGIARAEGIANQTASGLILGTPHYMAPEQVTLKSPLDARSDVYSLGVALFHMACGRPPFDDSSPIRIGMMQAREAPPRPSSLDRKIWPETERAILRAMAKDPAERFQTAEAFAEELEAILAAREAPKRPSPGWKISPDPAELPTLGAAEPFPPPPGFAPKNQATTSASPVAEAAPPRGPDPAEAPTAWAEEPFAPPPGFAPKGQATTLDKPEAETVPPGPPSKPPRASKAKPAPSPDASGAVSRASNVPEWALPPGWKPPSPEPPPRKAMNPVLKACLKVFYYLCIMASMLYMFWAMGDFTRSATGGSNRAPASTPPPAHQRNILK